MILSLSVSLFVSLIIRRRLMISSHTRPDLSWLDSGIKFLWLSCIFYCNTSYFKFLFLNSFCRTDLKFCSCSDDTTVKVWDFARCQEESSLSGNVLIFLNTFKNEFCGPRLVSSGLSKCLDLLREKGKYQVSKPV